MGTGFYANLTPLTRFVEVTDLRNYTPFPPDWQIVITDVKGSTQAIGAGRYKEVNMVGASAIVALLNVAGSLDLPFVFGGDGATLAIPPELLPATRSVLGALQALAQQSFGLELRAGIVPVAELIAAAQPVRVARLLISEHYAQAAFSGGLSYAERLVKDPHNSAAYLVPPASNPEAADLTGLECRWQDIPSRYGETLSLLVGPLPGQNVEEGARVLGEVIGWIEHVYGAEREDNPIVVGTLRPSTSMHTLSREARLRAGAGRLARLLYLARILGLNLAIRLYRRCELLLGRAPWLDRYRELIFRTADYKKFDDTLRMILTGTSEQRARLEHYLERRFQAGELVYGIHVTDRALMTCLVFERMGRQVHFVDAADGGYALAAKAMKARLLAGVA